MNEQVLLTGANGLIGRVLRTHFAATKRPITYTDIRPLASGTTQAPDDTVLGDLTDAAFCNALLEGKNAVVHMAGVPSDAPFETVLPHNYIALFNLFEAARIHKIKRFVFASSNHATGMYPAGMQIDPSAPVNPDSQYGLSKVWGEAIARLYWEKHGIESVCLRIGSFLEKPASVRNLSTWLSHRDSCTLVDASLDTPNVGFDIVYGVSANTRSWWDNSKVRVDYQPQDNAEDFLEEIERSKKTVDPLEARLQGADFAAHHYSREQ